MEIIDKIKVALKNLESETQSIREYINTRRNQTVLLENSNNWNQICSSLDAIEDTMWSIKDYIDAKFPDEIGLKYIYTYGILQSLFIQQDALENLAEAFEIEYEREEQLKEIRYLRNASIGHPTKNKVKKITYYNYISQITMTKYGFNLLRYSSENKNESKDIDLRTLIDTQLNLIGNSFKKMSLKLEKEDEKHKSKFKNDSLVDMFSSMDYKFTKIFEGITNSEQPNKTHLGLKNLNSIKSLYSKFEEKLKERNEFNDILEDEFEEYKFAINSLKSFFEDLDEDNNKAGVFAYYISKKHLDFIDIAKEIDEIYCTEV